ncbi:MAG: hypothetical protein KGZ25_06605 [Planctomycetes bacterium]|nr:hypothetical protein [Planctomycetota bacterium]
MRLVHHNLISLERDRLECRSSFSRPVALLIAIVAGAGVIVSVTADVSPKTLPALITFITFPSFGLLLAGFVLYTYDSETQLDFDRNRVISVEKLLRIPIRTRQWTKDELVTVKVQFHASGRENKLDSFPVVTLKTTDEQLPLFQIENYKEARELSQHIAAQLGCSVNGSTSSG